MFTDKTGVKEKIESALVDSDKSEVYGEPIKVVNSECNYMTRPDFKKLINKWLNSSKWHHIVTLNPEMVVLADKNSKFLEAVSGASIRVPDGAGIIWARWYLRSSTWPLWPSLFAFLWQRVNRVTGVDAVIDLARLCENKQLSMYMVGGRNIAMRRTAQKLHEKFPNLKIIIGPDSGMKKPDSAAIIDDIKKMKPAVLLTAWGAPAQTIWLEKWKNELNGVKIAAGVGGAFDMIGEVLPRAPAFVRAVNLEWLWRLRLQPKRFSRIWRAVIVFPLMVRVQKLKSSI